MQEIPRRQSFKHLNLDQLRTFLAVAEELHFGRAARRLHMASSPVSRKIKELEAALDISLFERHTRHVELSPAGADLLPIVRDLVQKLDELRWLVARSDDPVTTPIRVGVAPGTHPFDRAMLLDIVRSTYAGRQVLPEVGTSVPLGEKLHSGELICTTLHRPLDDAETGTLMLSDDELGVVISATHPLAQREQISVSSLRSLRFVGQRQDPEPETSLAIQSTLEAIGVREVEFIRTDFLSDIAATVANTDYFTLTPLCPDSPLHRSFLDPGLVIRRCTDLNLRMSTVVVWLEARARTDPHLATILELLRCRLGTSIRSAS